MEDEFLPKQDVIVPQSTVKVIMSCFTMLKNTSWRQLKAETQRERRRNIHRHQFSLVRISYLTGST
ncbi:uncharacterized protein Dvir_GJ26683 [Drosophila virilis]|uniref:Uncharacterized protein n=1 Tax=Drosophila virilis TaxID=7244 RepID=A0A0Q9W462_DROVI|nr:uncharacterized protein Dvir_GJ26683 [Drosophila virilis]